jgi:hypothetical protein
MNWTRANKNNGFWQTVEGGIPYYYGVIKELKHQRNLGDKMMKGHKESNTF